MNWTTPSFRLDTPLRRAAAGLGALMLLSAVWLYGLSPLLARGDLLDAEIQRKLERITRLEARIATLNATLGEDDGEAPEGLRWRGARDNLVAAEVISWLQRAAGDGLRLRSITPHRIDQAEGDPRQAFRLEGDGALEAMFAFLHRIEGHQPLLLVNRLQTRLRMIDRTPTSASIQLYFQLELIAPYALSS